MRLTNYGLFSNIPYLFGGGSWAYEDEVGGKFIMSTGFGLIRVYL